MPIRLKRVYDPPDEADGARILVERLWPRGLSKQKAALRLWVRDLAPSTELRKWFGHRPERWEEFRARYFAELEERDEDLEPLLALARGGTVTFVFASREERTNNAVALREFVRRRLHQETRSCPR
jgi:uncharacterized protein YeaO (DUF488 family)